MPPSRVRNTISQKGMRKIFLFFRVFPFLQTMIFLCLYTKREHLFHKKTPRKLRFHFLWCAVIYAALIQGSAPESDPIRIDPNQSDGLPGGAKDGTIAMEWMEWMAMNAVNGVSHRIIGPCMNDGESFHHTTFATKYLQKKWQGPPGRRFAFVKTSAN